MVKRIKNMTLPVSEQDPPYLSIFHLAQVIQRISPKQEQDFWK